MMVPTDKFCPMAANNTNLPRTAYPCLGVACAWFNDDAEGCVVLVGQKTAKPVAKTTAKKNAAV